MESWGGRPPEPGTSIQRLEERVSQYWIWHKTKGHHLELRSRKKFFEHVRVLTSHPAYSDWEDLLRLMMRGLKIAYDSG